MRIPIQIVSSENQLFALCNDGTVWRWEKNYTSKGYYDDEDDEFEFEWCMVSPIPQPEKRNPYYP